MISKVCYNFAVLKLYFDLFKNKIKNELKYYLYKNYSISMRESFIKKQYLKRLGKELNWDSIETYNEKINWSKLYGSSQLKTDLSDKYKVRNWIEKKIGNEYLIPLIGVWDNSKDIDFNILPNEFVLKTNHAAGTNLIVKNKATLNIPYVKRLFYVWLSNNFAYTSGFQMQYEKIEKKIICEKFMSDSNGELNDYKFLCFNGEVRYCWVDKAREENHRRNIYDLNWNLLDWNINTYANTEDVLIKPKNFEKMIELAKILCKEFDHVRVDFYNVDGKIYFGEMTFTTGNGFLNITPSNMDLELGKIWNSNL